MRKNAGSLGFWAATILLVLVAAFFVTATVMSRTSLDQAELEGYYRETAEQLVRDARKFLITQVYQNSGVMLTRVVGADGSRVYTVTLHHGDFDRLEEAEREALVRELTELEFADENAVFCHKFLDSVQ